MRSPLSHALAAVLLAQAASQAEVSTPRAINEGGLRIFQVVESGAQGNLCLSPYSIQAALAMAYAGASGQTATQMATALDFPESAASLADGFRALNSSLASSVLTAGNDSSLRIANRLFGAKGFAFRPPFLGLLRGSFDAPLEELDFRANPDAAAAFINQWVADRTEKRIQNLIPAGALNRATTLVLVNALYLKMPWLEEFPLAGTTLLPFQLSAESAIPVPTMTRTGRMGYKKIGGFTALGIPLRGGDFQFLVLLPEKPTDLPTARDLAECAELPAEEVRLFLPKFRLEPPTISLAEPLKSLGMRQAFDIPEGSANFDGMAPRTPNDYLYISDVFHKTFFALDEKGVEAAAATAVVMMRAMAMPVAREPIEVRVDRPFLFAIQHVPSGTCLFFGKVVDPR